MSGHQRATIGDTVYFWFAANDTSGSGGDGATPLFDVREAGAAASAIPLLSGTPALLTHANYPAGLHEIAVAATVGNGFAADDTFAVFCTIAIDSQNPSGFCGSCTLTPLATTAELDKVPKSDGTASWNATALAAINAEADTAISDGALGTAAELAKVPKSDGTSGWNATALAAINAEADTAISDAFTFTKANELDVNMQSINGAAVTGDGNATPWDGE